MEIAHTVTLKLVRQKEVKFGIRLPRGSCQSCLTQLASTGSGINLAHWRTVLFTEINSHSVMMFCKQIFSLVELRCGMKLLQTSSVPSLPYVFLKLNTWKLNHVAVYHYQSFAPWALRCIKKMHARMHNVSATPCTPGQPFEVTQRVHILCFSPNFTDLVNNC